MKAAYPTGGAPRAAGTSFTGQVWALAGSATIQGRLGTTRSDWTVSALVNRSYAIAPYQNYYKNSRGPYNTNGWSGLSAGTLSAGVTGPEGNPTATKLIPNNSTNGTHSLYQTISGLNTGEAYTWSFKAKQDGYSKVLMIVEDNSGSTGTFTVDLTNGSTSGSAAPGAIVEDVGNGYYRISKSRILGAGGQPDAQITIVNNLGQSTFIGDGTSGIDVTDFQVVRGLVPLPDIPTLTNAAPIQTASQTQASSTLVAPMGALTIVPRIGTAQAGKTTNGLGNSFFPTAGYPTAASGPWPGFVDVSGLTVPVIINGKLGTISTSVISIGLLASISITGKSGTTIANDVILPAKGVVTIAGLSGTDSASVQVLGAVGAATITPKMGTSSAGSIPTGAKGTVTITGKLGQTQVNDVIAEGPPRLVVITGKQPVVISNNLIPAKTGSLRVVGKQPSVFIDNRRRRAGVLTALRG